MLAVVLIFFMTLYKSKRQQQVGTWNAILCFTLLFHTILLFSRIHEAAVEERGSTENSVQFIISPFLPFFVCLLRNSYCYFDQNVLKASKDMKSQLLINLKIEWFLKFWDCFNSYYKYSNFENIKMTNHCIMDRFEIIDFCCWLQCLWCSVLSHD